VNINIFFSLIIVGLFAILFLFKPLEVQKKQFGEIPTFELEQFRLLELSNKGLTTIMDGNKAIKYTDKYIVQNINYTDSSKKYIANMIAKNGIYEDDTIKLDGDILFTREDGLSFLSQHANYNKKTNIVISPENYIATLGKHEARGSYLEYNNNLGTMKSKDIEVNYMLKREK